MIDNTPNRNPGPRNLLARKTVYFTVELAVSLALLTLVHVVSDRVQAPLTANQGRGWDGVWYAQMAEQIANGQPVSAPAPFVYRIGVPFLASLADTRDIVHGFRKVNIAATYLTTFLLALWFRLSIDGAGLRFFFLLLFLCNWLAPPRVVHIYPANVDVWAYPFLLIMLLLIHTSSRWKSLTRVIVIAVLCAVGVLVRETVAIVTVAVPFAYNPLRLISTGGRLHLAWRGRMIRFLLPTGCALMVLVTVHQFVHPVGRGGSFWLAAMMWSYSKSWLAYCHSWFVAFGPILFIPVYHFRDVLQYFSHRQYQAAYMAALVMITLVSPADIERHVLVAVPIIYTLIAYLVEKYWRVWSMPLVMGIVLISQALASRVFFTIAPDEGVHPAYVLLTPLSSRTPWHDLFPLFAIPRIAVTSFWEYVVLGVALLLFVRFRSLKGCISAVRVAFFRARNCITWTSEALSPSPSDVASSDGYTAAHK